MWAGDGDCNARLSNRNFADPMHNRNIFHGPFSPRLIGQVSHRGEGHFGIAFVVQRHRFSFSRKLARRPDEKHVGSAFIGAYGFEDALSIDLLFSYFNHSKISSLRSRAESLLLRTGLESWSNPMRSYD